MNTIDFNQNELFDLFLFYRDSGAGERGYAIEYDDLDEKFAILWKNSGAIENFIFHNLSLEDYESQLEMNIDIVHFYTDVAALVRDDCMAAYYDGFTSDYGMFGIL